MNRQIKRLGIFIMVLYLALFVRLNMIQVVEQKQLEEEPLNSRPAQREYARPRGSILSVDGTLLAVSRDMGSDATLPRVREYPEKELYGQVTGFLSFRYGTTGMEQSYNDQLTGQTFRQQINGLTDLLVNRSTVGDVYISVRKDVQQAAKDALGPREGSVVALDPRTGAILAFWSYPSFDPNLISTATGEQQELNNALLNLDPTKPLLAHQYQERYPPGSTFKVVTAGTGLQTGKVTNEQPVYPFATSYLPPQTNRSIQNFGGSSCGGPLPVILEVSCNSAFAEMGQSTIGATDMVRGAESFGFNQDVPIDLPGPARSIFPIDVGSNPPKLAQASIGQNDVAATPLQIALNSAGVAHGGVIMKPHVMKEVRDREQRVVDTYEPQPWLQPLSAQAAETLKQDMYGVVARGSGTNAQIPGVAVGGKTGTAQIGDPNRVHTWFTAVAGPLGGEPTVAVAVVVLNQENRGESTGGQIAAPIAKQVMTKILQVQAVGGL